jgi:manganese/iron transport system permease protein/iron/zinc/copper transport system permease protein
LTVVVLFFRHFQVVAFDPVMAASIGLPVVLLDYALTTCVSLVVVSAVSMVGVILVVGLLITPAATAYLLSDRLSRMMALAALFGVTGVVGGLYLSVWLDTAGGGAIMLFATAQFLAVLTVAPRYGLLARWLRLHRLIPQQVMEDVLGTVVRGGDTPTHPATLQRFVQDRRRLRRALRNMTRSGLLEGDARAGFRLTEAGKAEATRVLRAHRLWETYLAQAGTPPAEIHGRAHRLEHVREDGAVEYLDELLGHPRADPHGAPIPGQNEPATPGD